MSNELDWNFVDKDDAKAEIRAAVEHLLRGPPRVSRALREPYHPSGEIFPSKLNQQHIVPLLTGWSRHPRSRARPIHRRVAQTSAKTFRMSDAFVLSDKKVVRTVEPAGNDPLTLRKRGSLLIVVFRPSNMRTTPFSADSWSARSGFTMRASTRLASSMSRVDVIAWNPTLPIRST
jgi:hypothetical protein